MYEARRGKLWFLPSVTVDFVRYMGMEAVLPNTPDADCVDASTMLDFID